MVYYLCFLTLSMIVLSMLMMRFLPEQKDLEPIPLIGALAVYVFVVFGFVSCLWFGLRFENAQTSEDAGSKD